MELSTVSRPPKAIRNPEASRARILDAARIEFVSHGLSGGRVDRIAEQSSVNKNLIYHYFGSKDALYLAVLERIYADLRARQRDQELRGLPPVEGMKRLVSNTFDHFVATPDLIRLMSIENIHYAEHLKSSASTKSLYGGLLDTIRILLKRARTRARFAPMSTRSTSICRSPGWLISSCPISTRCPGCSTATSRRAGACGSAVSTSSRWC